MKEVKTPDWVIELMTRYGEDEGAVPWICALACFVFAMLVIFAIVVLVYS